MRAGLLVALVACGEPIDPLAGTRAAWQDRAIDTDWPAHAVLVVAREELGALALQELKIPETVALKGPMGLPLIVRPIIASLDVTTRAPDDGDPGVLATGTAVGTVDVQIPPFVRVSALPVTVSMTAPLQLSLTADAAPALVITPTDPDALTATALFESLPTSVAALADGVLEGWLLERARTALADGVRLGPAPRIGPVGVIDARLVPGHDLTVELRLPAAARTGAADPPAIAGGWGIAIDVDATLQAARVLSLQQPPTARYLFEPLALAVDGDQVTVDLRWHRRSRRGKWRDLRVDATLVDDGVQVAPRIDEVGAMGALNWAGDGPLGIVKSRAQAQLDAQRIAAPKSFVLRGLSRRADWSTWAVEGDDLVVRGTLAPLDAP